MAEIVTESVTFPTATQPMPGYLARPAGDRPAPAVIVIQEWWGVDEHIKDVTRRFAAEGFAALSPDLYRGDVTNEPDRAGKLMMALNMPRAADELVYATRWLRSQPFVSASGMGATGFCMGGGLATTLASNSPEIKAAVPFYGVNPEPIEQVRNIQAKMICIYAEHDEWATQEMAETLRAELREYGKDAEFITYPGTHHAFFNDTGEAFNREARDDSWRRMLTLFREALR